jgi:hypothetical protein
MKKIVDAVFSNEDFFLEFQEPIPEKCFNEVTFSISDAGLSSGLSIKESTTTGLTLTSGSLGGEISYKMVAEKTG